MLFSLILVGLLASCARTENPGTSIEFDPRVTYVYEYTSRFLSGIPTLADQYSGFEVKANLIIQAKSDGWIGMQLDNVLLATINDEVPNNYEENIDMVHRYNKAYYKELSKPVWFLHENGKVKSFRTDQSEPEWSINVKKSILSLFNLNLTPEKVMQVENGQIVAKPATYKDLTYYGLYERGISGICETVYEIKQMPDTNELTSEKGWVLNVTKTRNFDNCLTQPSITSENFDIRGCLQYCRRNEHTPSPRGYYPVPDALNDVFMSGCPCDQKPTQQAIDQFNFVKYNISNIGRKLTVEGIFSEGKVKLMDLLIVTHQNVTLTQQRIVNEKIVNEIPSPVQHNELSFRLPIEDLRNADGRIHAPDFPVLHVFGLPNYQEWYEIVPKVVEKIADDLIAGDVSSTEETTLKINQIVLTLAALPYDLLGNLFEEIADKGRLEQAVTKDQVLRQIFLDLLAYSSSKSAALLIKHLIETDRLTTLEAKRMVEVLPNHMYLPDLDTMDAYLDLCQSPKIANKKHLFASVCITFAKLIHSGCIRADTNPGDIPNQQLYPVDKRHPEAQMIINQVDPRQQFSIPVEVLRNKRSASWTAPFPQKVCHEQHIQKYVNVISLLLRRANTFHSKNVYMKTLEYMKTWQVIPVLERWSSGRVTQEECPGYPVEDVSLLAEECIFMRLSALRSLEKLAIYYPKKVLAVSLPIYRDISEPYQIRAQAFANVFKSAPGKEVLESIASDLHTETNKQLRNFVFTAFGSAINSTFPCYKKLAEFARDVEDLLPEVDDGMHYSAMEYNDVYDRENKVGAGFFRRMIANNISSIPRTLTYQLNSKTGLFTNVLAKFSMHQKGLESVIDRLSEPNGIFTDAFEGLFGKRQEKLSDQLKHQSRPKRNTNSVDQALEALKQRLNFKHRSDDIPKVEIVHQFLHQSGLIALDEKAINQLIDEMEDVLGLWAQQLIDGFSGHFVRIFYISHYLKLVPSELGIPILARQAFPLILSLKVDHAKLDLGLHPKSILPIGFNLSTSFNLQMVSGNLFDIAGINMGTKKVFGTAHRTSTRVVLPFEMNIGYIRPKNLMTISFIPKLNQEWFHYSSEPFTYVARKLVANAPDVQIYRNKKVIKALPVPFKVRGRVGHDFFGVGLRYEINSENPWILPIDKKDSFPLSFVKEIFTPKVTPMELHITPEADDEFPTYGIDMTFRYKWIADEEGISDIDDSDESSASNESDSDSSDESSSSESSASNSSGSKSDSSETSEESSESTKDSKSDSSSSSEESSKSRKATKISKKLVHKLRIHKMHKESQEKKIRSKSSDSSSSSSSSSDSSESSSESDSSESIEDAVFDYEDVLSIILGHAVDEHTLKKYTKRLVQKTKETWLWAYDEDSDESSSDESHQTEKDIVPATITHNLAVSAVLRGPTPTFLAFNFAYIHTFDHRTNWLKFDGHIKSPVGVYMTMPHLFCFDSVIAYPHIPNEFYYDPTTMQDQKAKIKTEFGWGEQCKQQGGVIITGILEKVEDQVLKPEDFAVQKNANIEHLQEWFQHQCQIDRAEGKSLSWACSRAILKDSYFNRLVLDIKYKNVPKVFLNYTQKFDSLLKYWFWNDMENNAIDISNPEDQLRIVADYSSRVPGLHLLNLKIQKPNEETIFEKIHVPYFRPPSSIYHYQDVLMNVYFGYQPTAQTCALMENSVRTFDNVTFTLPETNCQYLLAMDCSAQESFSVFAKELDSKANTKKVTIWIHGQELVLMPPQEQKVLQVQIDGKTEEFTPNTPRAFCHNDNCMKIWLQATQSNIVNAVLVIDIPHKGLIIKYDGKNVKIDTVDKRFRGKICGLCGNNDGETDEEFVGPNLCIYDQVEDFVYSYTMGGDHCEKINKPVGFVRCPKPIKSLPNIIKKKVWAETRRSPTGSKTIIHKTLTVQTSPTTQEPICQKQRNIVFEDGQMICFSVKPMMTCGKCRVKSEKMYEVDFHCLPAQSPFTQKLVQEAQIAELKLLANKKVDRRIRVTVPETCYPIA